MSAPTEAGSYTLTVTIAETANTFGGTASVHFTVARTQLAVPTLGDSGANKLTAVYEDEIAVLPITGFDPLTMGVYGVAVSIDGSNENVRHTFTLKMQITMNGYRVVRMRFCLYGRLKNRQIRCPGLSSYSAVCSQSKLSCL